MMRKKSFGDITGFRIYNAQGDEVFSVSNSSDSSGQESSVFSDLTEEKPSIKQPNVGNKMLNQFQKEGMPQDMAYDPSKYYQLPIKPTLKLLFHDILKYQPVSIQLVLKNTDLKAFIPEYIPCVGQVNAGLNVPRPDGQKETLGLTVLDEHKSLTSKENLLLVKEYAQISSHKQRLQRSSKSKKNKIPSQKQEIIIPKHRKSQPVDEYIIEPALLKLFKDIQRYNPIKIPLNRKMKAFLPEYIPAMTENITFLKVPRPDGKPETLGLTVLDQPSLNRL